MGEQMFARARASSRVARSGPRPLAGPDYFFATTIVLIVAVTFSTTSTTTM